MPILLTLSSVYPKLNDAERKVADFILQNPEAARAQTITRLAALCGVSQSTINRFCRVVGYEGYMDFKLELAGELQKSPRSAEESIRNGAAPSELQDIACRVYDSNLEALRDAAVHLDYAQLGRAVEVLGGAAMINLFGAGSSLPVAMDLFYRLRRTGLKAQFSQDTHMQVVTASLMEPGEAAVAISYSGESRETLDAMELARDAGAATVCITGFPGTTLAKLCDISLITPTRKNFVVEEAITARLAQLALCDVLCAAISRPRGEEVAKVIKRIDASVVRKRRPPEN